jgi:hypothetical protein
MIERSSIFAATNAVSYIRRPQLRHDQKSTLMQFSTRISQLPMVLAKLTQAIFLLVAGAISLFTGLHYPGNPLIFAAFCVLGNVLLLNGLRQGALFFDTFIAIACYRWCGRNWILCSLFAQVIAFRFAGFGYVAARSYLLFGNLALNGLLILSAERLLARHPRYHLHRGAM